MNSKLIFILMTLLVGSYAQNVGDIEQEVEDFFEDVLDFIEEEDEEINEIIQENLDEVNEWIENISDHVVELIEDSEQLNKDIEDDLTPQELQEVQDGLLSFKEGLADVISEEIDQNENEDVRTIIKDVIIGVHNYVQNFTENARVFLENNPDLEEALENNPDIDHDIENIREDVKEIIEDVLDARDFVEDEISHKSNQN